MSGAVQLNESAAETWQATGTEGIPNLQQVAADRLAAHRQRRAAVAAQEAESETRSRQHREALRLAKRDAQRVGATLVRDAVKARYQGRESYREFLAAEAERVIAQAQAEAEVAARSAHAVAEAQMALLQEYDEINQPEPGPREEAMAARAAETRQELAHALADIALGARELIQEPVHLTVAEAAPAPSRLEAKPEPALREVSTAGLTVRLFEDMPQLPAHLPSTWNQRGASTASSDSETLLDPWASETLTALDEEIDFRRAPDFPRAMPLEVQAIPGNLIEFPRELVAPRRARPRLAEGPLRDELQAPQLRIFEVDAVQMEPALSTYTPSTAPEWQTLQLSGFDAEPSSPASASDAQTHLALPLYAAPMERRAMAAMVDLCCVGAGWMIAFACACQVAGPGLRVLPLPLIAASALGSYAALFVVYQLLFFSLAEGTPGMRYARIALCTFGEANPSRRAMRRRILSGALALCPLGLGLLWALLDNDGLGWHDRMSRMYQRAY